jgi:hypothetical protein
LKRPFSRVERGRASQAKQSPLLTTSTFPSTTPTLLGASPHSPIPSSHPLSTCRLQLDLYPSTQSPHTSRSRVRLAPTRPVPAPVAAAAAAAAIERVRSANIREHRPWSYRAASCTRSTPIDAPVLSASAPCTRAVHAFVRTLLTPSNSASKQDTVPASAILPQHLDTSLALISIPTIACNASSRTFCPLTLPPRHRLSPRLGRLPSQLHLFNASL